MLTKNKLQRSVASGFVSISDNIITLNTDTFDYWIDDDAFYNAIINGTPGDVLLFSMVGNCIELVHAKLVSIIPKLIMTCGYYGRVLSIGIKINVIEEKKSKKEKQNG